MRVVEDNEDCLMSDGLNSEARVLIGTVTKGSTELMAPGSVP